MIPCDRDGWWAMHVLNEESGMAELCIWAPALQARDTIHSVSLDQEGFSAVRLADGGIVSIRHRSAQVIVQAWRRLGTVMLTVRTATDSTLPTRSVRVTEASTMTAHIARARLKRSGGFDDAERGSDDDRQGHRVASGGPGSR